MAVLAYCYNNRELVDLLNYTGCRVKNVHELNLILEEMGILEKTSNGWLVTEKGGKYSPRVFQPNSWRKEILPVIGGYIQAKQRQF